MKEFEVWCEGCEVPANPNASRGACLIGKAYGSTFADACENFRFTEDTPAGMITIYKGESLRLFRNGDGTLKLQDGQPVYNMCRLYDNEADAKRNGYIAPKPRRRK